MHGSPGFPAHSSVLRYAGALVPFMVVGALIYGGVYVKPTVRNTDLAPAVIERGDYMYGAAAIGAGGVLAVGSHGKIWRADTGLAWRAVPTPLDSTLQDIAAWDGQHVVAVGDRGAVIVTSDGGLHWQKAQAPLSSVANKLLRVVAIPGGEAWAVGEAGAVLHGTGYGRHWQRARDEEDIAWNGVAVQGERVWVVGEFGNISFSPDSGRSWRKQPAPVQGSLMAVAFRDAEHGVAVGVDGVVLTTANGGGAWTRQPLASQAHLYDVAWDGGRWLAVGDKGLVAAGAPDWRVLDIVHNDRRWHTRILAYGGGMAMSGASFVPLR